MEFNEDVLYINEASDLSTYNGDASDGTYSVSDTISDTISELSELSELSYEVSETDAQLFTEVFKEFVVYSIATGVCAFVFYKLLTNM